MASTLVSRRSRASEARRFVPERHRRSIVNISLAAGAVAVVAAGLVARFYAPTQLWLDEALSVDISRLPLDRIPAALRQDGAPPLYYVLLHFWMLGFGEGNFAVRAFSGLAAVAALPLLWFLGRRVGGRRTALVALLLGASSPFAVYYATDTRMYALMIFLSLAWTLCGARALERPTRRRLAAVALLTAALLYTHYWGLYLVVSGGACAQWQTWRDWQGAPAPSFAVPGAAQRLFVAMVAGSVLWVPWAPTFVFQALHTGTPWAAPASPENLVEVFAQFSGTGAWAPLLAFLLFGFLVLAVFARPGSTATSVSLEGRVQPRARVLGVLVAGTLVIAVAGGMIAHAAFVNRYMAVVFPLFIVLCALGATTFAGRRVTACLVGLACVAGLATGFANNAQPRSEAVQVASVLNVQAKPGDVVLYCPDQLGPAVNRLIQVPGLDQVTFPRMLGPARIDWIDYASTIAHTDIPTFASEVLAKVAPHHTLWVVWRNGYPPFGGDCGYLVNWLQMDSQFKGNPIGETVIRANPSYYEHENLVRFPIA